MWKWQIPWQLCMRETCSRTTVCSNSHLNWPVKSGHTSDVNLPSKSAFWLGTLPSVLLGVRNIYIFPSNLSKCLKWLQKALFTLCCCFSGPFSQNLSFGAPVNSHETFYCMPRERLVAVAFAFLYLLLEFYSELHAHKVVSITNNSCDLNKLSLISVIVCY